MSKDENVVIFEIEGAWVGVEDSSTYMDMAKGKITFTVRARIHHQNALARKEASKILRNNGWGKDASMSDDFLLKKVVQDELKIVV